MNSKGSTEMGIEEGGKSKREIWYFITAEAAGELDSKAQKITERILIKIIPNIRTMDRLLHMLSFKFEA